MIPAPKPINEAFRLRVLRQCGILDTAPEAEFDDISRLAARFADTPIALVSLVDESRQWFKSRVGLDASETPRDVAFCGYAILADEPLVVPDARLDPRFANNPLVTGMPGIRFYAGWPLRVSDGVTLGTLCVIDTKPRELDEGQIRDLEGLARLASAQLELRLRAHDAERAAAAKAEFLASMSHEIRTPMTAILGYSEVLLDERDAWVDETIADEALQSIQRNGRHLLALINDILDVSRLEAGRLSVEPDEVDPHQLACDAVTEFIPIARSKGLSLRLDACDALPARVRIDPVRLRQIIFNLLGNALKFTSEGSVTLSVSYDTGSSELRVLVQDTGEGMSPEERERIARFEVFSQGGRTHSRRVGGAGLGLCISHGLATAMSGGLALESELGRGTRVSAWVTAPACAAADAMPGERADAMADAAPLTGAATPQGTLAGETATGVLAGLRVLLVEDGEDNQRLVAFHLRRAGAAVEIAAHGGEALDAVRGPGEPFAMVLMDMQMPVMDGYAATRALRGMGFRAPIVALTAFAMEGDRARCLDAGCDDYLTKPIKRAALIEACARWTRPDRAAA